MAAVSNDVMAAVSNGGRNDKRTRDNGGSEHEEGEVSDTREGGMEDSMND